MAKNDDVLSRFASAGDNAVGLINRVDDATAKFQPSQRKGSIVKSAQGNVFEFPVFISNSIPLDYATATTSLLEQIYAAYLQMAISINPVVKADSVKNGLQFADYKTNTNKYLEYTDTSYQHDACHAVYQEDGTQFEFNMLSIEDSEARLINESVDHQPLSEFDHFFQEAPVTPNDMLQLYPVPLFDQTTGQLLVNFDHANNRWFNVINPATVSFLTIPQIRDQLQGIPNGPTPGQIDAAINNLANTVDYYNLPRMSGYDLSNNTNRSDQQTIQNIQTVCGHLTPEEFADAKYDSLRAEITRINQNNPGFSAAMNALMNDVSEARIESNRRDIAQQTLSNMQRAQANNFTASAKKTNADIADINYKDANGNQVTSKYEDHVRNQRELTTAQLRSAVARAAMDERNNNTYNTALGYINTTGQALGSVASAVNAGVNAAYNISTFKDRKANQKLSNQNLELQNRINQDRVDNLAADRALRKTEVYGKMKTSDIHYIDDSKCQKLNTMKPLLMSVTINMLNKDDSLQPINYIIGVKTHMRVIPASILPEVARYPLKEMDKLSRKVKWRAGELKFLKDLVFRIDEKKQTAADSRDPNRKWYRRLYELAHMKGDAPASAVVQGKSIFSAFIRDKQGKGKLKNGMMPNASIIMSQNDVDNIKNQTDIDLLKASNAKKFCGELFLISLIIVDIDAESIKILLPDQNNDYDVHSLAAVQKQLATLDTSGTKTRDMFKLLG